MKKLISLLLILLILITSCGYNAVSVAPSGTSSRLVVTSGSAYVLGSLSGAFVDSPNYLQADYVITTVMVHYPSSGTSELVFYYNENIECCRVGWETLTSGSMLVIPVESLVIPRGSNVKARVMVGSTSSLTFRVKILYKKLIN
jgi:hypothetical protein